MEQMFFLAGVLIIVMSCHPYSREVEAALVLSGDNRSELEQVLNHFRQKDSRKFEAACFLIANMPYLNMLSSWSLSVLIPRDLRLLWAGKTDIVTFLMSTQ